jgi:8-oxo-dGTP diphosphatase
VFSDAALSSVVLQDDEISDHRLAAVPQALTMLRGPIRRRVGAALDAPGTAYLEDGRPVPGVQPRKSVQDPAPHGHIG